MADEKRVAADGQRPDVREVEIRTLMGDAKEIVLLHAGARYRLRITANDKLILTK